MLHIVLLVSFGLLTQTAQSSTTTTSAYEFITPALTKHVNLECITEDQQTLINATTAFNKHAKATITIDQETRNALEQTFFISEVLPKHLPTITTTGLIQAAVVTTQFSDNITELNRRQKIVRDLLANPTVITEIDTQLKNIQTSEKDFFSLFQEVSEDAKKQADFFKLRTDWTSWSNKLDFLNNKHMLGFSKRINMIAPVTFPLEIMIISVYMIKEELGLSWKQTAAMFKDSCSYDNLCKISNTISALPSDKKVYTALYMAYIGALFGYIEYLQCKNIKEDFDTAYRLQQKLINIAQIINSAKNIHAILDKNPTLQKDFLDSYMKLDELFDPSSRNTSSNLKKFIAEITSSSFKGDPTYYFSKQGTILATNMLLEKVQEELVQYMQPIGYIDAHVAAAKLYQQYQNHTNVHFCMPQFVDQAQPIVIAQEFWHPLINPNNVVTNSLAFDHNTMKNMIITGPNAGGKTTTLTALIINVIFAQTFGIAPSTSLTLTPFTKIHSYLDITTDLQAGLSLFAAEVDRAKRLKESINSCKAGQKTFTIIDEMFTGTNPAVASDICYKFAQQLGTIPYNITIITTHFPQMTGLEKDNAGFTNFKVADATINPDNSVSYPFKLVPGISTQNIAQHMLEIEHIL